MPGDLISRYYVLGVSVYKFTGTQSEGPHNFTSKLMADQYWSLGKYGNTISIYIYIHSIFAENTEISSSRFRGLVLCRFYWSENSNKSPFLNTDYSNSVVQDCSNSIAKAQYLVYKATLQKFTCLTGRLTFPGPVGSGICWTLPLWLNSKVANSCPRAPSH